MSAKSDLIVDCHAHIKGGDAAKREFTGEVLVRQADEAGVAKTLVFSMSLPSRESNDLTRARIRGYEDRLVPLCHVLPTEGELALEELDRSIGEWGWKGVKMHWGEYRDVLSVELLDPVLTRIGELGVPVLV
ncbi:MAG TPA: hypothetical protein EYP85_03285, partial [Armatimonadetes bacterium]|nr:hypothetical protein [Armatimonadota bacterium]